MKRSTRDKLIAQLKYRIDHPIILVMGPWKLTWGDSEIKNEWIKAMDHVKEGK